MSIDSGLLKECIADAKAVRCTFLACIDRQEDCGEHITKYWIKTGSKSYTKKLMEERMDYVVLDEGPNWVKAICKYYLEICNK